MNCTAEGLSKGEFGYATVAVVFGGVTPVQGDVVHFGCIWVALGK
jgi:hypothetical protein